MCLLITGKSNAVRTALLHTAGLIEDIFTNNADGLGVMYGTSKGLKVCKTLPNSAAEVVIFLSKLPTDDREVAIHFRWRTHGDINLDQCHPYPVNETTAMMHNGVLEQGNAGDKTKSDTWHFIEDYMKSLPIDTLHDAGFTKLLGDFVGNNRFAIMSGDGRLTVVNQHQGVSHDGVWFSNTYAWEPSLLIPTYKKPVQHYTQYKGFKSYPKSSWGGGVYQGIDAWDEIDYEAMGSNPAAAAQGSGYSQSVNDEVDEYIEGIHDDVDMAVLDCDAETLTMCLEDYPLETLRHIFETYEITPYDRVGEDDLTPAVVAVRQNLVDGDILVLLNRMEDDTHGIMTDRIASALCWYCVCEPKMEALA